MGEVSTDRRDEKAKREAADKARAEKELADQKRQAEQQTLHEHQSGEGGIVASIIGFIKFLWEKLLNLFSPNRNAPEEEPDAPAGVTSRPPQTSVDLIRIGKSVVSSGAIGKWHQFQRDNRTEKVEFVSPLIGGGTVTSNFGMRDLHGDGHVKHHDGIDMVSADRRVGAVAKGVVLFSDYVKGYGNMVVVGHSDGRYTLYAHMTGDKQPALGTLVAQGQQIGVLGNTGHSKGAHLHFEVLDGDRPVQPIIKGVQLTKGMALAPVSQSNADVASLVDPASMPKLAVQNGGKPQAIAMRATSTGVGAVRGS